MKNKNRLLPNFTTPARVRKTQEFYKLKHPEQDVKILFFGNGGRFCGKHIECLLSNQDLPYVTKNVSVEEIFDHIIQQFGKERIEKREKTNIRNIIKFSSDFYSDNFNEKFASAMLLFDQNNLNIESYSYACCYGIPSRIRTFGRYMNNVIFNYGHIDIFNNTYRNINKNFRHFSATRKKTKRSYIYGQDTDYQAIESLTHDSFCIVV